MPRHADESNNHPMKIKLEFTDVEILEVNDITHTITIKMHLGVHWNEPRLVSLDTYSLANQNSIDIRILEYMWLPDLDIYNIKEIDEFKVLKKLAVKKTFNNILLYNTERSQYLDVKNDVEMTNSYL